MPVAVAVGAFCGAIDDGLHVALRLACFDLIALCVVLIHGEPST